MAIVKCRTLFALQPCGCLSHAMIVDEHTKAKDVGDFWAKCHERGVQGSEVQPGEEHPAWECEQHRRERLGGAKQGVMELT